MGLKVARAAKQNCQTTDDLLSQIYHMSAEHETERMMLRDELLAWQVWASLCFSPPPPRRVPNNAWCRGPPLPPPRSPLTQCGHNQPPPPHPPTHSEGSPLKRRTRTHTRKYQPAYSFSLDAPPPPPPHQNSHNAQKPQFFRFSVGSLNSQQALVFRAVAPQDNILLQSASNCSCFLLLSTAKD